MINFIISGIEKLQKVEKIYKDSRKKLRDDIMKECRDFAIKAINRSKADYLSGPRPDKLDIVTGRLRSSIRSTVLIEGESVKIVIGTDIIYGPIHEFGGYTGRGGSVYIRPRPFLKPAAEDERPEFQNRLANILSKVGI